jgi:hypothetical protein
LEPDATRAERREVEKEHRSYYQRCDKALAITSGSCSRPIQHHLRGIEEPDRAWEVLHAKVNTSSSEIGRQQLAGTFTDTLPIPGKSMEEWYTRLNDIKRQLHGTESAISDVMFNNHIKQHLPVHLKVHYTSREVMNKSLADIIHILVQEKRSAALLAPKPAAATEAFVNQTVPAGRGRGKTLKCNRCGRQGHVEDVCWAVIQPPAKGNIHMLVLPVKPPIPLFAIIAVRQVITRTHAKSKPTDNERKQKQPKLEMSLLTLPQMNQQPISLLPGRHLLATD